MVLSRTCERLIFPDLHSANVASKLVDTLTRARNYGPILTGLAKPAAEISRGASAGYIWCRRDGRFTGYRIISFSTRPIITTI